MQINTLAFFLGLAASASAHMRMREPQAWFSSNAPLLRGRSDFPCHGVAYDDSVPRQSINKGESSPLKFLGSAVHGGGSCQISLTTDLAPDANSVWKVIKSFEGGCPARNQPANFAGNAELLTPDEFDFVIPEDVPAGKYTLAWTWFNKVGNREMYMNCAPAEAVGSGGDQAYFDSLPDMFVANIDNEPICDTEEGIDLKFPNAGEFIERSGTNSLFKGPPETCPGSGAGSGSGGSTSPPVAETPVDTPVDTPEPTVPGGVFIEDPEEGDYPEETEPTPAPAPAPAPVPKKPVQDAPEVEEPVASPPAQPVPINNGADGGSGFAPGTACTTEGHWNCIAGTSFQRCASGAWSAAQQVSAGTSCTAGISEVIQLSKRGTLRFGAKFLL